MHVISLPALCGTRELAIELLDDVVPSGEPVALLCRDVLTASRLFTQTLIAGLLDDGAAGIYLVGSPKALSEYAHRAAIERGKGPLVRNAHASDVLDF